MIRPLVAGLALALAACASQPPAAPPPAPEQPVPPVSPPADPSALPPASAAEPPTTPAEPAAATAADPFQRNGRDIYFRFRDHLAQPQCNDVAGSKWQRQFRHAAQEMAKHEDELLPVFGYVSDALIDAGLPTEFALIPFVESGYHPAARNPAGPAGLWQFISSTARHHGIRMTPAYDGRLSPVESTQAAVAYLKRLHDEFGGQWQLAIMAYNAGEFRIKTALRKTGLRPQQADPARLPGVSAHTHAYAQKLHALACVLEEAGEREDWLQRLDREVPRLTERMLPAGTRSLETWSQTQGLDAGLVHRLNPALARSLPGKTSLPVLVPAGPDTAIAGPTPPLAESTDAPPAPATPASSATHTVIRGESAWSIARRHGTSVTHLLDINQLKADSVLKPGMVLRLPE